MEGSLTVCVGKAEQQQKQKEQAHETQQKLEQKPTREQEPEQEQEHDPSKVAVEMNISPNNTTPSEFFIGGGGRGRGPPFNIRGKGLCYFGGFLTIVVIESYMPKTLF